MYIKNKQEVENQKDLELFNLLYLEMIIATLAVTLA